LKLGIINNLKTLYAISIYDLYKEIIFGKYALIVHNMIINSSIEEYICVIYTYTHTHN